MYYLFYISILMSKFREGTSWKWIFSLIMELILSSRTVSASEFVYDNFHEVPLSVIQWKRTPFILNSFSFSRVLKICFVLIVKASIMIQCGDVKQNPGPV